MVFYRIAGVYPRDLQELMRQYEVPLLTEDIAVIGLFLQQYRIFALKPELRTPIIAIKTSV